MTRDKIHHVDHTRGQHRGRMTLPPTKTPDSPEAREARYFYRKRDALEATSSAITSRSATALRYQYLAFVRRYCLASGNLRDFPERRQAE